MRYIGYDPRAFAVQQARAKQERVEHWRRLATRLHETPYYDETAVTLIVWACAVAFCLALALR